MRKRLWKYWVIFYMIFVTIISLGDMVIKIDEGESGAGILGYLVGCGIGLATLIKLYRNQKE